MSADDGDEPLVELVAVDGRATTPTAGPAVCGPDLLDVAPRTTSRRARLLVGLAAVAVGAGVLATALTHRGDSTPAADVRPHTAASAAPSTEADPAQTAAAGLAAGGLLNGHQAEEQAAQLAEERARQVQLEQQMGAVTQTGTGLSLAGLDSPPPCPAASHCEVEFGSLPARALAAVTSRMPHAQPIASTEASGYVEGALYFRQVRVIDRGCVVTVQLTRADGTGQDGGSGVTIYAADGRVMTVQYESDGGLVQFALSGTARHCPSTQTLARIAFDPRLLAAG